MITAKARTIDQESSKIVFHIVTIGCEKTFIMRAIEVQLLKANNYIDRFIYNQPDDTAAYLGFK